MRVGLKVFYGQEAANRVGRAAAVIGLFLGAWNDAEAGTINARSAALSDVAAAVTSAKDGDVVAIPQGTASWAGQLSVTKNITLQGAGMNNTNITTTYAGGTSTSAKGAIRFEVTKDLPFGMRGMSVTHNSQGTQLLWVVGGTNDLSAPHIPGISTQWRMTDVKLVNGGAVQSIFQDVVGVNDHCVLTTGNQFAQILHPSWNGKSYAHGSWSSPVNWGGPDFLFWEDCTITYNGPPGVDYGTDGYDGARFVVRHCILNSVGFTSHGTETHFARGTRAGECYNNVFTNGSGTLPEWRSGTIIAHDNVCTGYGQGWALRNHRNFLIKDLGAVTGVNLVDQNTSLDSAGNPTNGNLAPNADIGTVTTTGGGTMTDARQNWVAHQWRTNNDTDPSSNAGYVYQLVNTTKVGVAPANIVDNTSTQITFYDWTGSDPQPTLSFAAGDHYSIRKVYGALDQPGRGLSDSMVGYPPSPAFWPHQQLDPCYSWNNWSGTSLGKGIQLTLHVDQGQLKEGRDFYNGTVKPGYRPYIYPHPLTGDPGPSSPSNLQISP